jgi:hypothetical protein
MSEVFYFDQDDHPTLRRRQSEVAEREASEELSGSDDDVPNAEGEPYTDQKEPLETTIVPIQDGFVSSHTEEFKTHKKVSKDDFELLKLIGTGGYCDLCMSAFISLS